MFYYGLGVRCLPTHLGMLYTVKSLPAGYALYQRPRAKTPGMKTHVSDHYFELHLEDSCSQEHRLTDSSTGTPTVTSFVQPMNSRYMHYGLPTAKRGYAHVLAAMVSA